MIAATAAAVVTCVGAFMWRGRSDCRRRIALLVALGVVNVVSALGADRGVVLVYGQQVAQEEWVDDEEQSWSL